jgi:hypothetical protein
MQTLLGSRTGQNSNITKKHTKDSVVTGQDHSFNVCCGAALIGGGSVGMWWLSEDVVAQTAKRQSYTKLH